MVPKRTQTHTHNPTDLGSEIFIGNWNSFTGVQSLSGLNLAPEPHLPEGRLTLKERKKVSKVTSQQR